MQHLSLKAPTFALLLAIAFLFSACRKDRGPRAFGFILASGTNAPIEGATVDLYKGDSFTGPWTFDRTLTTSSDGAYEFVILDNDVYRLSAYHPEYFDVSNGYFQLSRDDREENATLTPHAYIKLHVENVAPVDELDRITIGILNLNEDPEILGKDVNLDRYYFRKGNQFHNVGWTVVKNGKSEFFLDSIYATAHDTSYYEILY